MSFNAEPFAECIIAFVDENNVAWVCESCGASVVGFLTTNGLKESYYHHLETSHKLTHAKSP